VEQIEPSNQNKLIEIMIVNPNNKHDEKEKEKEHKQFVYPI
jgi:hypothetical protein